MTQPAPHRLTVSHQRRLWAAHTPGNRTPLPAAMPTACTAPRATARPGRGTPAQSLPAKGRMDRVGPLYIQTTINVSG